jgi:hypothetical protein
MTISFSRRTCYTKLLYVVFVLTNISMVRAVSSHIHGSFLKKNKYEAIKLLDKVSSPLDFGVTFPDQETNEATLKIPSPSNPLKTASLLNLNQLSDLQRIPFINPYIMVNGKTFLSSPPCLDWF